MQTKLTPDQLLYYLFCGAFFVMPFGTSPFTILGLCILLTPVTLVLDIVTSPVQAFLFGWDDDEDDC